MKKTLSLKLLLSVILSGAATGNLCYPLRADTQQFAQELQ